MFVVPRSPQMTGDERDGYIHEKASDERSMLEQ
jgi:hypothetical protein